MSYAERAVFARHATARWRMGHGSPAPLELIGAQFTDLVIESIRVIRELDRPQDGSSSSPASRRDRELLTSARGCFRCEYVIVGTLREHVAPYLEDWTPSHHGQRAIRTGTARSCRRASGWLRFRDEVAPHVVYGLYRATAIAPPQLFYAHADHAAVAARIALADSVCIWSSAASRC